MVHPYSTPGAPGPYWSASTPPPPPPKKSNRTPLIVLGIVAVTLLLACCGGVAIWAVTRAGGVSDRALPKVGETTRQGDLEITVTAAPRCGVKQVGSGYRTDQAEGQFCLIDLRFTNVGKRAIEPASYGVELVDESGGETSLDYLAGWYASPEDTVEEADRLFRTIYPGKTVTGILAFDIPVDEKPDKLLLNPSGDFLADDVVIDLG